MKRKVTVIITREGEDYIARCPDVAGAVARGTSRNDALERIAVVIRKKLGDGSDGGAAAVRHPVSPRPRGPVAAEEKSPERPRA